MPPLLSFPVWSCRDLCLLRVILGTTQVAKAFYKPWQRLKLLRHACANSNWMTNVIRATFERIELKVYTWSVAIVNISMHVNQYYSSSLICSGRIQYTNYPWPSNLTFTPFPNHRSYFYPYTWHLTHEHAVTNASPVGKRSYNSLSVFCDQE